MKLSAKAVVPHITAILLFIIIPSVYFPSMFEGKELNQSDIKGYLGMAKEIKDFRAETGEDPLWTNSMFSGMPAYLIDMTYPNNILIKVYKVFSFQDGRPVVHIFLYLLGFYLLLLLFGINPWLGIVGSIAYGFSSYFFIILAPGHLTKAIALGYMPMIIGSVYYSFRKDFIIGAILTSIFVGLQLIANHLQITYYTFLILLIFGVFELVDRIIKKDFSTFMKAVFTLLAAAVIAVSVNIVHFWSVMEYSEYSLRGPSELSHNDDDQTSGLDKSYATGWSYGIGETLNLLIPNFKGGSSAILMADQDSKSFEFLSKSSGPQNAVQIINQNAYFFTQYWGDQPGTSGPVYIGAAVVFLFVFGLFFVNGRIKWWLFSVFVFSVLLAWGKNFMFLTDWFLDHFPGYNKFRTVSMILVMAQLAMPLLAILAVDKLISGDFKKKDFLNSFKYSLYVVGGLTLLFSLIPAMANLSSPKDQLLLDQGARDLVNAIREDRAILLRQDAIRSLVFVLLTAGLIYGFYMRKIKLNYLYIGLGILFLADLWPVNKRYLNEDNFVNKRAAETPYQPMAVDLEILKDTDLYYRVFDLTPGDPFGNSRAAYFHKSVGGYHGAKMRRYQEVYDFHLKDNKLDPEVLDMLNTKYLIKRNPQNGQPMLEKRTSNLGNAWFVADYKLVENADDEITELGSLDPSKMALVDKRFAAQLEGAELQSDSSAQVDLVSYAPNRLEYKYKTNTNQLMVFSDIYYPKGWEVTVNGSEVDYFRANYILRSMVIEAGKGSVVFEFRPKPYFTGAKIAFAGSTVLVLLILGGLYYGFRKRKMQGEEEAE